jgi:hypothetical protein
MVTVTCPNGRVTTHDNINTAVEWMEYGHFCLAVRHHEVKVRRKAK